MVEGDAEGGGFAVEFGQHPLAIDEATVFADSREVVAHLHAQRRGCDFASLLEVEGFDIGCRGVGGDYEVAIDSGIGFEPTTGFAFDAAFDYAGRKGGEFVVAQGTEDELCGLEAYDQRHAELPSAVRRIGGFPRFDGVDGRDVAAVFLKAVEQEVVVIDHSGRHLYLIVAPMDAERPTDGEAVGEEVVGRMLGDVVHGDEGFETVRRQ